MIALVLAHPHIFWLSLGGLLLAAEMLGGSGYLLWSGVAAAVTGLLTWILPLGWEWQGTLFAVLTLLAAWLWLGKRTLVTSIANSAPGRLLGTWWYNAWGFDWLYDKVFVKPFLGIAWLLKSDPLNALMNIPAILSRFAGKGLVMSENGYLRWYVASMSIGAVVVLALLMVLR